MQSYYNFNDDEKIVLEFVRSEQKWQTGRHSNYSVDDGRNGSIFCIEIWTMCFIIIFEIQFKLNNKKGLLSRKKN